jgi:hypothetical protein
MVSGMDKILGVSVIGLAIKTEIERIRISGAPIDKAVLFEGGSLSVDNVTIDRVELRQYLENLDQKKGIYSLITVYLKSSRGEMELKFDEGFKGKNPLPEISLMLTKYIGLESLLNRLVLAFNER